MNNNQIYPEKGYIVDGSLQHILYGAVNDIVSELSIPYRENIVFIF